MTSSPKKTMTYREIIRSYDTLAYEKMPCCGFNNQVTLLQSIPDVVEVLRTPGAMDELRLVPSRSSIHIQKFVAEQMPQQKKSRLEFPSQARMAALGISNFSRNCGQSARQVEPDIRETHEAREYSHHPNRPNPQRAQCQAQPNHSPERPIVNYQVTAYPNQKMASSLWSKRLISKKSVSVRTGLIKESSVSKGLEPPPPSLYPTPASFFPVECFFYEDDCDDGASF